MLTSTRLSIPYPDPTNELDSADVPRDLQSLVAWLDRAGVVYFGPIGSRPTSSSGTPGIVGRWYWATDTLSLSFDYGTGWLSIYPHAASHAIGGTDPVTPQSIGAVNMAMLIALGG